MFGSRKKIKSAEYVPDDRQSKYDELVEQLLDGTLDSVEFDRQIEENDIRIDLDEVAAQLS
jgi:hypothetical protein